MTTPIISPVMADSLLLTNTKYVGTVALPEGSVDQHGHRITAQTIHKVICELCGDVTRFESGGTVDDAPLPQATLFQQRHLARHLKALATEIERVSR